MFHIQELTENGIQQLSATGTILAGDVAKLFGASDLNLDATRGFLLVIGPDFDGYLSELAKGLERASTHLSDAQRHMAVVMTDGMLHEASLTGLKEDGATLRTFPADAKQAAIDWLQSA